MNQYTTKHHPKNPIRAMATKRRGKLIHTLDFLLETAITLCLAFGFYVLVVFIFGVGGGL